MNDNRPDELDNVVDRGLTDLYDDQPAMTDEAFNAGRERLLAAMRADSTPTHFHASTERDTTAMTITEQPTNSNDATVTPLRRSSWRRWGTAAAAAAIIVGGVGATQVVGGHGSSLPSANAAAILDRSAGLTAHAAVPAPGQFTYVSVTSKGVTPEIGGNKAVQSSLSQDTWIPVDLRANWTERRRQAAPDTWVPGHGEGPVTKENGTPAGLLGEWTAPCGNFAYVVPGSATACDAGGDWSNPTPAFVGSLPQDPAALYQNLLDYAKATSSAPVDGEQSSAPADAILTAGRVLSVGWITPEFRANLYRAIAKAPDLTAVEHVRTSDGREGTALGVDAYGTNTQIIVDPSTGEYLGVREVLSKDANGFKAGTEMSVTSVTTKIVNNVGDEK